MMMFVYIIIGWLAVGIFIKYGRPLTCIGMLMNGLAWLIGTLIGLLCHRTCIWMVEQWHIRDAMSQQEDPVIRIAYVLAGAELAGVDPRDMRVSLAVPDRRYFDDSLTLARRSGWVSNPWS